MKGLGLRTFIFHRDVGLRHDADQAASELSTATAMPESEWQGKLSGEGIIESILNEKENLADARCSETDLSVAEGFVPGSRKYSRALLESTSKHSRLG